MDTSSLSWSYTQLFQFFGPRIFFSILCGGLVGLERELKGKPAGIKTNILICLGSCLFSSISELMAMSFAQTGHYGDPARLAAQIVSGIGFLGGGAIIQSRGTVLGLTTAATIWVVAAIGVCIGIGHPEIAVLVSVTVVVVLVLSNWFEDKVLGRSLTFSCEIVVDDPKGEVRQEIHRALSRNDLMLDDFDIGQQDGRTLLSIRYRGHRADHKKFVLELWGTQGICEVKRD